ncbi:MAG: OadG family protein [Halanaerobiales bacterium]
MEKYIIGAQLMIVGMGTVMLALFLLSVVMNLSKKFIAPEKVETGERQIQEKSESDIRQVPESNRKTDKISSRKVVAITTAVRHLYQQEKRNQYRIISITRNRQDREGR